MSRNRREEDAGALGAAVAVRLRQALELGPEKRSMRWLGREIDRLSLYDATYSTVYRYLTGETEPPLAFVEAAAVAIGVSQSWLLTGEGKARVGEKPWDIWARVIRTEFPPLAGLR